MFIYSVKLIIFNAMKNPLKYGLSIAEEGNISIYFSRIRNVIPKCVWLSVNDYVMHQTFLA